jgi:hypothetical protein
MFQDRLGCTGRPCFKKAKNKKRKIRKRYYGPLEKKDHYLFWVRENNVNLTMGKWEGNKKHV